jgi:carboxyl-terminal processing protease
MNSAYVTKLFNSDSSREFILDYVTNNKDKFAGISMEDYHKNFRVTDEMLQGLVKVGERNKIEFDSKDFNKSKDYLKVLVKAHLGRQLYDDSAFYKVINDINEVYLRALNLFDEAERISLATDLKVIGQ